jgi:hypothetical protein
MAHTEGLEDRTIYRAMPRAVWVPPTPQLIRGARMLIVGSQADPEALAQVLPPGLTPDFTGSCR